MVRWNKENENNTKVSSPSCDRQEKVIQLPEKTDPPTPGGFDGLLKPKYCCNSWDLVIWNGVIEWSAWNLGND